MVLTSRTAALVALGLVPVLLVPSAAVVGWWLAVVAAVALTDALLAAPPRGVSVRRSVSGAVRQGQTATSTVEVTAGARRLRGIVRDAWEPSVGASANRHRVDLAPGRRVRLTTGLTPTRRGERHAAHVTVRSLGPLRLAGRQATMAAPASVRVLPAFSSRRHLPSRLARLREMDGRTAVQVRGQGTEFDSLREYVIGDDVRAIDWRATARRGEVLVRTWRPERDRQVLIVCDTSRLSAVRLDEAPRLDAQIESGLLLGALAARAGDRVSLIAVDSAVRARVAPTTGGNVLPVLADALAPLEPALREPDWTAVVTEVRARLPHRALVVLMTAVEPSGIGSGLLPAVASLARDHVVLMASAVDPLVLALRAQRGSAREVYDAAAAERDGLEREQLAVRLRRSGAVVVEAGPEDLPPAVADAYLHLKSAGKL